MAMCVVGALTLLLLGTVVAGPAGAHGPTGTLGLEARPGGDPLTARVRALLEYSNDREVAPGATVTVEARDASGRALGPQPMSDQGRGLYETTLTLPTAGTWTLAVVAANPAATGETTVTVSATAAATTAPAPADDGEGSNNAAAPSQERTTENDDDGGGSSAVVIGIVAVLVLAAIAAAVYMRRRRATR
jgi:cobalamin biosynthesis Mg chelatase CobN